MIKKYICIYIYYIMSSSKKWILLLLVGAVIVSIIFSARKNAIPFLYGLTIEEAEFVLKESGKNIKLGEKIGFEQPVIGKSYLLGKISKQEYIPSENPDNPGILNYTLFQIDTNQIDTFLKHAGEILQGQDDETVKQLQELSTLSQDLDDLYKIEDEKEKLQKELELEYENQAQEEMRLKEEQLQSQRIYEETQRKIAENQRNMTQRKPGHHPSEVHSVKKQRRVVPVVGLVNEITIEPPKNNRNRLQMEVPDRASSTNVYSAKESFFW